MKPNTTADVAINVRPQAWEEAGQDAGLYDGIYLVTLNHTVELRVFPDVDRSSWPPPLPDGQPYASVMTARRALLAMTVYACVVDDALAGSDAAVAQFPTDGDWAEPGRCFFVGTAEHEALRAQLDALVQATGGVHRTVAASSLQGTPLARLVERLVRSPHLAADDRRSLGL